MIKIIAKTTDIRIVHCDFCEVTSETQRIAKCRGCERDVCIKHSFFENIDGYYDNTATLCANCIQSFSPMNKERTEIDSDAERRKDLLWQKWKASVRDDAARVNANGTQ